MSGVDDALPIIFSNYGHLYFSNRIERVAQIRAHRTRVPLPMLVFHRMGTDRCAGLRRSSLFQREYLGYYY
jgi:hypothetical protein